jgi:hypothetical protein
VELEPVSMILCDENCNCEPFVAIMLAYDIAQ